MTKHLYWGLFLSTALVACSAPDSLRDTSTNMGQSALVSSQGSELQGTELQGTELQGTHLQGTELQGTQLQGTELQGTELQGTLLSGVTPEGVRKSGPDLIGAVFTGVTSDGGRVPIKVDNVELDPLDLTGETWLYTLLSYDAERASWYNICPADPRGLRKAIPLGGTWDATGAAVASTTKFTFACTSGVLAKCVRWGYKPWQTVNGMSLADSHQACTRMARADYCGNGVSHTKDGTFIDIEDNLKIQQYAAQDGMAFEALWLPSGAYCLARTRWHGAAAAVVNECPDKVSKLKTEDIMAEERCAVKLSSAPRSQVLLHNRSYLVPQLAM